MKFLPLSVQILKLDVEVCHHLPCQAYSGINLSDTAGAHYSVQSQPQDTWRPRGHLLHYIIENFIKHIKNLSSNGAEGWDNYKNKTELHISPQPLRSSDPSTGKSNLAFSDISMVI